MSYRTFKAPLISNQPTLPLLCLLSLPGQGRPLPKLAVPVKRLLVPLAPRKYSITVGLVRSPAASRPSVARHPQGHGPLPHPRSTREEGMGRHAAASPAFLGFRRPLNSSVSLSRGAAPALSLQSVCVCFPVCRLSPHPCPGRVSAPGGQGLAVAVAVTCHGTLWTND